MRYKGFTTDAEGNVTAMKPAVVLPEPGGITVITMDRYGFVNGPPMDPTDSLVFPTPHEAVFFMTKYLSEALASDQHVSDGLDPSPGEKVVGQVRRADAMKHTLLVILGRDGLDKRAMEHLAGEMRTMVRLCPEHNMFSPLEAITGHQSVGIDTDGRAYVRGLPAYDITMDELIIRLDVLTGRREAPAPPYPAGNEPA